MRDDRAERVADVLVGYSLPVEHGQFVSIRGPHVAAPLLLAIYRRCLDAGAHPLLRPHLPEAEPHFYRFAQEHQLSHVWETERWMTENVDATFSIIGDTNTRQLSRIDPERQAIVSRARRPLLDRFFDRSAKGETRWNLTLYPTEAHAQDAGMSLAEYEDFFYAACLIDAPDPISEWKKIADGHVRLIEWIDGRNEVHLEGE